MKKLWGSLFVLCGMVVGGLSQPLNATGFRAPANFADLVTPLLPAVVNISTTTDAKKDKRPEQLQQMSPEELFRQFLEEGPGGMGSRKPRKSFSLGSGFIIEQTDQTVFVVTCNHLIADADEVKIILQDDKTEIAAEVVGRDARTDLALLKFKSTKKLAITKWADSSKARVGEWIIAIGNPFGLSSTVTAGIISTIARDIGAAARLGAADYVDGYIQTDASINMGNSGGPMFNMDGEVIAVSTAIFSPNGGSIGIGFGIPSNLAMKVIDQLKKFGRTKRGWIGIKIQQLEPALAESLGLKEAQGALVSEVTPQGPAAKSGIRGEDVILSLNGVDVKDYKHLQHLVGDMEIGKKIPAVIWRNGKKVKMDVTIGEFEKAEQEGLIASNAAPVMQKETGVEHVLGLATRELTPAMMDRSGLTPDQKGIVVEQVLPDSDAELKGVQRGDILIRLLSEGHKFELTKPAEFKKIVLQLEKEGKKTCTILVRSGQNLRYVSLKISGDEPEEPAPVPAPRKKP